MSNSYGLRMNRRTHLGLLLGGLAAAAATSRALGATEQTTFDIGGNRDPQLGAQIAIADHQGYFKEQGLDVSVKWTEAASDLLPLMASNAINVAGLGTVNVAALAGRGVKLKIVSALCDYAGSQSMVLRPGLTLASPKDLAGRKIAAPPASAPHEVALKELGDEYGFDAKSVQIIRMLPSEAVVAVSRGDVDGALTFQPYTYKLQQLGAMLYFTGTATYFDGKETLLPADKHLMYIYSLLAVNEAWLAANPNSMIGLLKAIIRANDLIANDLPTAEKIVADFLHADQEAIHQSMAQNHYGVALDAPLVQSFTFANQWLQNIDASMPPLDPATAIDPTALRAIDPSLVSF